MASELQAVGAAAQAAGVITNEKDMNQIPSPIKMETPQGPGEDDCCMCPCCCWSCCEPFCQLMMCVDCLIKCLPECVHGCAECGGECAGCCGDCGNC